MSKMCEEKEWFETYHGWLRSEPHTNYYELGSPYREVRDAQGWEQLYQYWRKNNKRKNIYKSVFGYKKPIKEVHDYDSMVFDKLVIDLDFENLQQNDLLRAYSYSEFFREKGWPHQIVFSGSKGVHFYFRFEPIQLKNHSWVLNNLKKWLRRSLNMYEIDRAAFNTRAQMIRIMNSQHQKTGLYCVPIEPEKLLVNPKTYAKTPDFSPDNLLFEKANGLRDQLVKKDSQYDPELFSRPDSTETSGCGIVEQVLNSGVHSGKREMTATGLALNLRDSGKPVEETKQILREWNMGNKPPLSEHKLDYKINYVYNRMGDRLDSCYFFNQVGMGRCSSCPWRKGK